MIAFAILGIIQALFLPGFLLARGVGRFSNVDSLVFSFPLSILFNYFFMIVAVSIGIYVPWVFRGIVILELLALLLVMKERPRFEFPLLYKSATFFLSAMFLALVVVFYTLLRDLGHVFETWDAVISWNRWAVLWSEQKWSSYSGYPQGVPALYSVVYVLAGSSHLQFMAKIIAQLVPFFGLLCFCRIASFVPDRSKEIGLAAILFIFFQLSWYIGPSFIFAGYADPFMACMGVYAIYAFIFFGKISNGNFDGKIIAHCVIFIAVATAGVIKQTGVILLLLFLSGCLVSYKDIFLRNRACWVGALTIVFFVAGHWYALTFFRVHAGLDHFGYAGNDLIPVSYIHRPVYALKFFRGDFWNISFFLIAIGLIFRSDVRKIFLLFFVPLYLFWSVLVSYDLRSAFIFIPWVSYFISSGLCVVLDFSMKKKVLYIPFVVISLYFLDYIFKRCFYSDLNYFQLLLSVSLGFAVVVFLSKSDKFYFVKSKYLTSIVASLAVILSFLPLVFTDGLLKSFNDAQQLRGNDYEVNVKLHNLTTQDDTDWLIASSYQLFYNIPGLENRFVPISSCSTDVALKGRVKYFVHSASLCGIDSLTDLQLRLNKNDIQFDVTLLNNDFTLVKKVGVGHVERK